MSNTLFGKPVQSVKGNSDSDRSLEYNLHPRVDPRIIDGLNELEQAMIAYISNSTAKYSDGRILPHAVQYEVGTHNDRCENDPLGQMALDYLRLKRSKDMPVAPIGIEIERDLTYNEIVSRFAVFVSETRKVRALPFYHDIRKLVNHTLEMALLDMKELIVTEEGEGRRLRYIHPRFIQYGIPSTAVPYLEVVLSIARDHPNMFSSSSWRGFEEFANQYDGFGDQHRLILDTLKHLEVFDDPRFNDIKTYNLEALESLLGDQASDFGTSGGDDVLTNTNGIVSILRYFEKIAPENYEKQVRELQKDKGLITRLGEWLKLEDKSPELKENLIVLGEILGVDKNE